ncbi:DUF6777 domain-containing protein [Kitasatospora sp. NPDC094015]|uniref:DUF6777 domain-containing protein n=1 Tax=Kitasatospora sp. NPDC094015 TaxID=3155205 RepID=UPI003318E779
MPPKGPPDRTVVSGSGGGGGGGGSSGAGGSPRPWWRGPRGLAVLGAVVAAVIVLVVVLSSGGGSKSPTSSGTPTSQQVALQPVGDAGPDPFTASVAAAEKAPSGAATASPPAGGTHSGDEPGLYAGSRTAPSCNAAQLADYLNGDQAKAKAWAQVENIDPSGISDYLQGLTAVVLRADTRVTNHSYSNGQATAYQAVLEAGTDVMVDDRGLPRVRCACGNPLLPPGPDSGTVDYSGTPWSGFHSESVVVVTPASKPITNFVLFDPQSGGNATRPAASSSASAAKPSGSHASTSGSASTSASTRPTGSTTPTTSTSPSTAKSSAASSAPASKSSPPAPGPSSGSPAAAPPAAGGDPVR